MCNLTVRYLKFRRCPSLLFIMKFIAVKAALLFVDGKVGCRVKRPTSADMLLEVRLGIQLQFLVHISCAKTISM